MVFNKKKTYKNFADALMELKHNNNDVSFGKIALGIDVVESYVYALATRKRLRLIDDKIMKKIAKFFHIEPSYFYEWRLKEH